MRNAACSLGDLSAEIQQNHSLQISGKQRGSWGERRREKLSFDQFPVSLMSAHQELRNAHFSAKVKEISREEI